MTGQHEHKNTHIVVYAKFKLKIAKYRVFEENYERTNDCVQTG